MKTLVFLVLCIGVSFANYGVPDIMPPAYEPSYGTGTYDHHSGDHYGDHKDHKHHEKDHKKSYKKLRPLHGNNLLEAEIDYYRDKDDVFALIKCKVNTKPANYFSWIMVESDNYANKAIENSIADTIPVSGGLNNTYVAKYEGHGKWSGADFLEYKTQKFRKVGCFNSETHSTDIK